MQIQIRCQNLWPCVVCADVSASAAAVSGMACHTTDDFAFIVRHRRHHLAPCPHPHQTIGKLTVGPSGGDSPKRDMAAARLINEKQEGRSQKIAAPLVPCPVEGPSRRERQIYNDHDEMGNHRPGQRPPWSPINPPRWSAPPQKRQNMDWAHHDVGDARGTLGVDRVVRLLMLLSWPLSSLIRATSRAYIQTPVWKSG